LLVAIAFLVFGRILSHGFVWWDDPDEIFANPGFVPPTFAGVAAQWTTLPDETHYYKPVTQTVWGLLAAVGYDAKQGGLAAWPFHFGSILVHGLAAVVVFLLLRRMTAGKLAAAFLGSLVFLLHPVQVEAVAWASGMKDLLCGLFTLLAVLLWVRATDPGSAGSNRGRAAYALATTCFVAAILSKPAGVIAPLLAGVAEWYAYRPKPRAAVLRLIPWLVLAAAATLLTKVLMPAVVVDRPALWQRPFVAGDALAFYLYKLVLPWDLAPDYGRRPGTVLNHWWAYVAWVVPAAVAAACGLAWRKGFRAPAAGFATLVAAVLPVLGFVPTEFQYYSTVADHYLYAAMFGVALVVAAIVERFGRPALIGAAAVSVVFGLISARQAGYWTDDISLFRRTVVVNPRSFAGYSQLGFAYLQANQPDASADAYRQSIRINADHPNGHDLWILYARQGDLESATREIGEYIRAANKLPPLRKRVVPMLHNYRGEMLMERGRVGEAAADFERALELDPQLDVARNHLARLRAASATQPSRQGG
jgi:tetratricopeptide (TPR) repeat protein